MIANATKLELEIYISPIGNDSWSGMLEFPNNEGTDGPVCSMERAKLIIRELKSKGKIYSPITVLIKGGHYEISSPIVFTDEDSVPVLYKALPNEEVIFDGGRRLGNWSVEEVNGKTVWTTVIEEVARGKWYFRQIFVDGNRRERVRMPKQGYYRIKDIPGIDSKTSIWKDKLFNGSDEFICERGDIKNWKNLQDVEVVAPHIWVAERMPIQSFDEETGKVKSSRRSTFVLKDEAEIAFSKYYVENVFEGLSEHGEWYLDRISGKFYYIPFPDESLEATEIIAPYVNQIIIIEGNPLENKYVEFLRFEGICFANCDWYQVDNFNLKLDTVKEGINFACAGQAANNVPGVISMTGARNCSVSDCKIQHIGLYGIDIKEGCSGIHIVSNEIYDVGAGGVKINGADVNGVEALRTGNNVITDNLIHKGSRVFIDGMGIVSMHSFGNEISHNEIHDLYQTGISCGWVWGYMDNISKENKIEKNLIYNIGQGMSSDMGGIYTLGVQPGTVVRGNIVHDIKSYDYGGYGIYPDEGSSGMLIENNICYNTTSQGFCQHFGRENIVRNNIIAFCKGGQAAVNRLNELMSFTFMRNILIVDGEPLFVHGYAAPLEKKNFISDLNLFWDISGKPLHCGPAKVQSSENEQLPTYDMDQWLELEYDKHSIFADPCMKNAKNYDFELLEDSPAFELGFKRIHTTDVGRRKNVNKGNL